MKIDGECLIELIGSCRNKVQISRSVRMPQLHTLLHLHLAPIVVINGSSRRDLTSGSGFSNQRLMSRFAGTIKKSLPRLFTRPKPPE